mgnify:CR=1 FL=1
MSHIIIAYQNKGLLFGFAKIGENDNDNDNSF